MAKGMPCNQPRYWLRSGPDQPQQRGEALLMRQLVHYGVQRRVELIDLLEHNGHQFHA